MIQTIVACTDGSADAEHALTLAISIARSVKAELVTLNVLDIAALTSP